MRVATAVEVFMMRFCYLRCEFAKAIRQVAQQHCPFNAMRLHLNALLGGIHPGFAHNGRRHTDGTDVVGVGRSDDIHDTGLRVAEGLRDEAAVVPDPGYVAGRGFSAELVHHRR